MFSANYKSITRRRWLGAAGLALAGGCVRSKGTGFPGYALVATAAQDSLAAVDLTSFRLAKTIPLNAPPTHVFCSGDFGYALTASTGSVYKIDPGLHVVAAKKLTGAATDMRPLADGERLVILTERRQLLVAELGSLSVLARYTLGFNTVGMDVAGSWAATSSGPQGSLDLLDTETGQRYTRTLPGELGGLRFRKDGKILMVANFHDRCISVLDVPSLATIVDLPVAMRPENLCFSTDDGQLFVSGSGMDGVAIIFPFQMEVEQTILAGRSPGVMACSAAPPYLFVASRDGSDVCILNLDSRRLIGLVEVGQAPRFILITPDSQYALILNQTSGDMAVIRIPSIHFTRERSGASLFTMVPVGDRPVSAAILPMA